MPDTVGIGDITFRMVNAEALSASPYSGQMQQYKWADQHWEVDITVAPSRREQARVWVAFLAALKSGTSQQFPTFLMKDPDYVQQGSQSSSFNASSRSNPNELSLVNLDGNTTGVIKAGDYISVGSGGSTRLHMVTQDVDSGGSGTAVANIWPDNRQVLSNAVAHTEPENCFGAFVLKQPEQAFSINSNSVYGINFTARGLI
jgi:hypothetical protein